jgi:hypothetical protein
MWWCRHHHHHQCAADNHPQQQQHKHTQGSRTPIHYITSPGYC